MAGFTAGNEKGELVLLGRNGSDYSAACLAACLGARRMRNLDRCGRRLYLRSAFSA